MCYKISIFPLNAKEMLMRKKCRRRAVLWDLFRPLPQQPVWSKLPKVRQKATRLMARLLLEAQATQRRGGAVGKEVGDE